MELIVKLYQDKASRLAVKYQYEYQAVKAYEDLLRKIPDRSVLLSLELLQEKISLTLQSDETATRVLYKQLDFKHDQVEKLITHFQNNQALIFVHVFWRANTLMVAKPFRHQEFISVSSLRLLGVLQQSW